MGNSFRVSVTSDLATRVDFVVYSGSANARCVFNLTLVAGSTVDTVLQFSQFSSGCDFSSVGAIEIIALMEANVDVKCPSSPCTVLFPLLLPPLPLLPASLPNRALLPVPPLLPTDAFAIMLLSLATSVLILFTDSTLSPTTVPRTSMILIPSPFLPLLSPL